MLNSILSTLGSVFTEYVPDLGTAVYDMFVSLFATTATEGGAITGLNELGIVAVTFTGIAIVSGMVSLALRIFRLRGKVKKVRRSI